MEWSAFRTDRSGHVGGIPEVFDHQPGRYFVWGVVRCVGGVGCGVWGCSVLFLRFAVGGEVVLVGLLVSLASWVGVVGFVVVV